MRSNQIAGCIVLFNPDGSVVANLATYAPALDLLIVVDNSPLQNRHLSADITQRWPRAVYHWMGANKGIAAALNAACEIALDHGCHWLLTMDQDSRFYTGGIMAMIDRIVPAAQLFPQAGILCANPTIHAAAALKVYSLDAGMDQSLPSVYTKVGVAITSGNLLNLQAYLAVGPFPDKLFIDHVDHEYCLRLRKGGYAIVQINDVSLDHSLGGFEVKTFLGKKFKVTNHNPSRRYYMTRNGLYVAGRYFSVDRRLCMDIWRNIFFFDIVKIVLFERQKLSKFRAVITGIYHYLINRYGQYEWKS